MGSNADRVIAEVRKWAEHSERKPQLDNIGTGSPPTYSEGSWIVNDAWRLCGYGGPVPWCGAFVAWIGARTSYGSYKKTSQGGCGHGATSEIERVAKAKNWWKSKPVPGALALKSGKHVTIVLEVHGDGTMTTGGGNESDKVSIRRQNISGWSGFVVPGDLGTASGGGGPPITMYAWERIEFQVAGGWATPEQRDSVMAKSAADPDTWTRAFKDNSRPSPYCFEYAPKVDADGLKTWGTPRTFGGWSSKQVRDDQLAEWRKHHPNAPVRIYNYKKPAPTAGPPSHPVEGDVKYT